MDISVNAEVTCTDGPCGRSTYIILDPIKEQVTHLVVKEGEFPFTERLVPVAMIETGAPGYIRLRCAKVELESMDPFIKSEFIPSDLYRYQPDIYMLWPYVAPESEIITMNHKMIPAGELAIRWGTHVKAVDGRVGRVDEFMVDPPTGLITHLVLREGHLWGQKDVMIPVSLIDHIENNTVYIKLDKKSIESLPTIAIRKSGGR